MLVAGLGISTALDASSATEEAARLAVERLGASDPDLALVMASAAYGGSLSEVPIRAGQLLGGAPVVGGSVEGIVGAGIEVSGFPGVLVLAVAGVDALPFLARDVAGREEHVGEDVAARVGGPLASSDLVIALPEALGLHAGRLVAGLAKYLEPALVLGTGAAATQRGPAFVWSGSAVAQEGVAGVVIRGARPRLAIAHAGRAVTPLLEVSRARGHWVLGLEGRSALEVYAEVSRSLGRELGPETESAPPLLAGLGPRNGGAGLLVRNVVGFDRERGGFSIPEPVRSGDRLALVELHPQSARETLRDQLERLRDPAPCLGLYFNCRARGAALFGEPGVEATYLANAFADCPILGVTGPFQLSPPVPGAPARVLTYAGVLAVLNGS